MPRASALIAEYKCPEAGCSLIFPTSVELSQHYRPTHGRILLFECVVSKCPYKALLEKELNNHIYVEHGGPVPHDCPVCDASFISMRSRKRHMYEAHPDKVRALKRPIFCKLCRYKARSTAAAHQHLQVEHGVSKDTNQVTKLKATIRMGPTTALVPPPSLQNVVPPVPLPFSLSLSPALIAPANHAPPFKPTRGKVPPPLKFVGPTSRRRDPTPDPDWLIKILDSESKPESEPNTATTTAPTRRTPVPIRHMSTAPETPRKRRLHQQHPYSRSPYAKRIWRFCSTRIAELMMTARAGMAQLSGPAISPMRFGLDVADLPYL